MRLQFAALGIHPLDLGEADVGGLKRLAHELDSEPQAGSLERCFKLMADAKVEAQAIERALGRSYASPVLTAHPTEVQRKSTLDAERAIALLLAERDGLRAAGQV